MSEVFSKKFSQQFQLLSSFTKNLGIKVTGLNQSPPKSIRENRYRSRMTKGVSSDLIKIYQMGKDTTFAFSFNYKNKKVPHILASTKVGEKIQSSLYHQEEFKEKFREFLRKIREQSKLTKEDLFSIFQEVFIGAAFDYNQEIPKIHERALRRIEELQVRCSESEYRRDIVKNSLNQAKVLMEKEVKRAESHFDLRRLKSEYERAFKLVYSATLAASKKYKVDDLANKLNEESRSCLDFDDEKRTLILGEFTGLPWHLREKVFQDIQVKARNLKFKKK